MPDTPLTGRYCNARAGKLGTAEAQSLLSDLHPDWSISSDGLEIQRCFRFDNYYQTIAFVNAQAWIVHQEDHHPDIEAGYNRCTLHFSTHSVGGLSENDFICAAKIDMLVVSNH